MTLDQGSVDGTEPEREAAPESSALDRSPSDPAVEPEASNGEFSSIPDVFRNFQMNN